MHRVLYYLLLGFVIVLTNSPGVLGAEALLAASTRSITTRGEATVKVPPDLFTLTFRVRTKDKELLQAYDLNEKSSIGVISLQQKYKLNAEDVQTSEISVLPQYGESYSGKRSREVESYDVVREISFTIKDRKLIGPLIRDALNGGANTLLSLTFETSELRKHRDKARNIALIAAKEKAQLLADSLGARIGKPLQIEEISTATGSPSNSRLLNNIGQNAVLTGDGVDSDEPLSGIAVGRISVKAAIKTTFELE